MKVDQKKELSEREIKTLYSLLRRFANSKERVNPELAEIEFDPRVSGAIRMVGTWVKWYAEEKNIDV